MEDDLNFRAKEKLLQCFGKWKTTSSVCLMEEELNILFNGRHNSFLLGTVCPLVMQGQPFPTFLLLATQP